jgi:hypothetical protein
MSSWQGLTEVRELARELDIAIARVVHELELGETPPEGALPDAAWLNVRLRERGCPEDQLATWRERIKSTPLRDVADQTARRQ